MSQSECVSLLSAFLQRPSNARAALLAGAALFEAGEVELAVAVWTLGDDANGLVRRIKDHPDAPPEGRRRSRLADDELCRFLAQLHINAVDAFQVQVGAKLDRVRNAIWPLTHSEPFAYRDPAQRPVIFYMPDLPANPVESNEVFGWAPALQASALAIRREYENSHAKGADVQPYVPADTHAEDWARLRGSLDWSATHLYQDAKATTNLARFPETAQALAEVDLARIDGVPMEAFFSRLKAGAHIPPHYGLTNSRLTVHLALIVPEQCAIRVGQTINAWKEGQILAFDDSFEHEAWNRSDVDRVVLIFETHHPDLSIHERAAIEHVFTVRQRWLDARQAKLDDWLVRAAAN